MIAQQTTWGTAPAPNEGAATDSGRETPLSVT
jgi:hypothetical protein